MKLLNIEQMHEIHNAALHLILENPGLKVENDDILDALKEKGIDVDSRSQIVTLPRKEVEETIRQVVGCDTLRFREDGVDYPREKEYVPLEVTNAHIGYMHAQVYDYAAKKIRRAKYCDMLNFIKVANRFGLLGRPGVVPDDVPQSVVSVHALGASLKYSARPVGIEVNDLADAEWLPRLREAATGVKENIPYEVSYVSTKSPLTIGGRAAEILLRQSRDGYLTYVSGMPMTGASTPITLASTLVMNLAERLGFNTISRLLCAPPENRFSRLTFGFAPCMMDIRKGTMILTGPERNLMSSAWHQLMGEFYKLPVRASLPMYVDAEEPGPQASEEKAVTALFMVFCCPNYHNLTPPCWPGSVGALNVNLALSLEQVLLDLQLFEQLNRLLRGLTVTKETMALDIMQEIGPGGSFLDAEHTLLHGREEFWYPKYNFRGAWDSWVSSGRQNPADVAHKEVQAIIEKPMAAVLDKERCRRIDQIIQKAEKQILGEVTGILP